MSSADTSNLRVEPRFHPGPQRVKWEWLENPILNHAGWLRDISLSGISFRAEDPAEAPDVEERIEVRQFPGGKPMFYEVMWVDRQKGDCVLGCSRIFPSPRLHKARHKPFPTMKCELAKQDYLSEAA